MKSYALIRSVLAALVLSVSLSPSAFAAVQTVDILVVYSNQATTVSQGRDIPALAASFVEYANQAYKNSVVDTRLRLVHIEKVAIAGDASVSPTALNNLARDQGVANLREQYGADLVVLLTLRQRIGAGFACGIGYVPNGRDGRFFYGAKFGGFSVTAVNCGNATFVHEVGHNMGLGHSSAQGSHGGIYPWARGHGEFNNFVTIMAYPQAYGAATRTQQFSSPDQVKCNGLRCGVARHLSEGADAVRNLNIVSDQVAGFFPTTVESITVEQGNDDDDSTPETPSNSLVDGSCDNLDQWTSLWGRATLQQTDTKVASRYGMKVVDRQAFYAGPILPVPLETGQSYQFSTHVALATPFQARTTAKAMLLIDDESGFHAQPLGQVSIVKGQWAELKADFELQATGQVNSVEVLIYGPPKGWDFYLDELVIQPQP